MTHRELETEMMAQMDPNNAVWRGVSAILDSARVNADDTVYVERVAGADWETIAMATISDVLSYCSDAAVCDWFASRGVRW